MGYSNVEEIKEYYSEVWENPKDIRNVVFESLNEYIRQRIPQGDEKKALDIGSGHGRIVSYLLEKGYQVTAVEFNKEFVVELKSKFPRIKVISEDVRNIDFAEKFDVITCIQVVQNLEEKELLDLFGKLAETTQLLLTNMSNRNSLHGRWTRLRGFMYNFNFVYTAKEFDQIIGQSGLDIVHRRGIGLVTPISLFKNFKGKLIPGPVAKVVNRLDCLFPKICHLYYVEAVSKDL